MPVKKCKKKKCNRLSFAIPWNEATQRGKSAKTHQNGELELGLLISRQNLTFFDKTLTREGIVFTCLNRTRWRIIPEEQYFPRSTLIRNRNRRSFESFLSDFIQF